MEPDDQPFTDAQLAALRIIILEELERQVQEQVAQMSLVRLSPPSSMQGPRPYRA